MSALKITNLSKSFNGFSAVQKLNLEVKKNKVFGFLGPNGAGKTTTIRMIVGLSRPDFGEITIGGQKRAFGKITGSDSFGYLSEQPSFYSWMSGFEYLNFVADIFAINKSKKKERINTLLKTVNLEHAKNKKIGAYSRGMKQRLGIAQALINDPQLLILDEPLSALDPIGRKETLTVIEQLKKGKTIFMSTHILSDVDRVCDDVAMINKGKLLAQAPLPELKAKYATLVLSVEFASDPQKIITSIKKRKWLKKLEKDNNTLKLWLKDEETLFSNEIIKELADFNIPILKYGHYLPKIEEVFMELMK